MQGGKYRFAKRTLMSGIPKVWPLRPIVGYYRRWYERIVEALRFSFTKNLSP